MRNTEIKIYSERHMERKRQTKTYEDRHTKTTRQVDSLLKSNSFYSVTKIRPASNGFWFDFSRHNKREGNWAKAVDTQTKR